MASAKDADPGGKKLENYVFLRLFEVLVQI